LVRSAHDCSEGGLAVALAESCIRGNIGAEVRLPENQAGLRLDTALFGESQSRIVLSVRPADVDAVARVAQARGAPWSVIGTVGGGNLWIALPTGEKVVDLPVGEMEQMYEGAIPGVMG
jgi:phosphoribosylformylglycinamidine synthase